jgi:hypothetical protein
LPKWLEQLGGLDPWWDAHQPPEKEWEMSRVIPRVKLGPNFPEWPIPVGTYWIDYETVTASVSKLPQAEWVGTLRSRFPEGSILLLGNIAKLDSRLALWHFRKEIWEHPLVEQVDAVVCPDMASYQDDPYPHGAVGERMTQIFMQAGHDAGKTMVPILSWQNRDALLRQTDHLSAMIPQVHTVYVELLAKDVDRTPWLFSRFDDLAEIAHLPFHWIFSGLDAGWAIRLTKEMFPRGNFSLVSIWPWMKTSFRPGTKAQKARSFRKFVHQFEDFHRGEHLPDLRSRPEHMNVLLWQKAQAEQEAQAALQSSEEAVPPEAEVSPEETSNAEAPHE